MKDSRSNEVILCPTCNGIGECNIRTSAYDSENVPCIKCNGTGRLVKVTTINYLPFYSMMCEKPEIPSSRKLTEGKEPPKL